MIQTIRDDSGRTIGTIQMGTTPDGRPFYRSGSEYCIGRPGDDLTAQARRSAARRRAEARKAERAFKAEVIRAALAAWGGRSTREADDAARRYLRGR